MSENIFLTILGFFLGILATLVSQLILRRFSFDNAKRKLILNSLSVLRERLDDSEKLFNCGYPDLNEFYTGQNTLNPNNPSYSDESSKKLYKTLVQYNSLRKILDSKERLVNEALYVLETNKVVVPEFDKRATKLRKHNEALERNSNSVLGKLELLRLCETIYFDDFPKKVVYSVDWDELSEIEPQDVRSLLHFRIKTKHLEDGSYVSINNSQSEIRKIIELREALSELENYRKKALELIEEIGIELKKLEQKWILPT